MDSITKLLLCIPCALILLKARSNYTRTSNAAERLSRKTPLPAVAIPFHHGSLFFAVFERISHYLPVFSPRWLPYARNDASFHWRNNNLPRQELKSDVFFHVEPGEIVTLKVGDPNVAAQIIGREDFLDISEGRKGCYIEEAALFGIAKDIAEDTVTMLGEENGNVKDLMEWTEKFAQRVIAAAKMKTKDEEVIATALASSILHLALYLDVQRDAQREVDGISQLDCDQTKLFTAIVLENLRLYPTAGIIRKTTSSQSQRLTYKDTAFTVPPQTAVDLDVFTLQRHPASWSPHPDSFNPKRWLVANGEQQVMLSPPDGAFLEYTRAEIVACLVVLVREYEVQLYVKEGQSNSEASYGLLDALQDRVTRRTGNFCFKGELPVKFVRRSSKA